MKKKIRIACLMAVFAVGALALCACGSVKQKAEAPLKVTADAINKLDRKSFDTEAEYSKKSDTLFITLGSYDDLGKVFKVINKSVKGKDLGTVFFSYGFSMRDEKKAFALDSIGKLPCSSIKVLGLDKYFYEFNNHSWTNILPKVETLYIQNCEVFKKYDAASKQKLASIKKLWIKEDLYKGIEVFSGVEEIGIFAVLEKYDDRISSDTPIDSDITTPAPTEAPTKKNGETKKVEPYRDTFIFNERLYGIESLLPLKKLKNWTRLTIAPTFDKYILDELGVDYLFAVSNINNQLMVNEPKQKLSDNKFMKIDDLVNSNSNVSSNSKEYTINNFISLDIKSNYKKGSKFKTKKKTPKLNDKTVVYYVNQYNGNYATKKKFHKNGRLLTSSDLGNSIKRPERAGDYRYFVYVYPVYNKVGRYDKGTKAYSETYYMQVFDMNKKRKSKPIKIATKQPEKKISVGSNIPDKHSGTVKESKIFKAIKKLAR